MLRSLTVLGALALSLPAMVLGGAGAGDDPLLLQPAQGGKELDDASPRAQYWARAFGGYRAPDAYDIQPLNDGSYILAGSIDPAFNQSADVWVAKLSAAGDIVWQKMYGGAKGDWATAIRQTKDGGYIVAGKTYTYGAGGSDCWILKLDATGKVLWQKTYGGTLDDDATSIELLSDGGYLVIGGTGSFWTQDCWMMKLDAKGKALWARTYSGQDREYAAAVQPIPDGGYVMAGSTSSFGAGSSDAWVMKLGDTGEVEWQSTYGGPKSDGARSIRRTEDGGYVVAGYTSSFGAQLSSGWILRLNADGSVKWQMAYKGRNCQLESVRQTSDGEYVAIGLVDVRSTLTSLVVLKLSSTGAIKWQRAFGGDADFQSATDVLNAGDGGYTIAGYSSGSGHSNTWVVRTDSTGSVVTPCGSLSATSKIKTKPTTARPATSQAVDAARTVSTRATKAKPKDVEVVVVDICDLDLSGYWIGEWVSDSGVGNFLSGVLTHTGQTLSGYINIDGSPCYSSGTVDGTVVDDSVTFGAVFTGSQRIDFSGAVDILGKTMKGRYTVSGGACGGDTGGWALDIND